MAHLISTDGYTAVVKIEPTTMMPHPPTLEPPVENPTYHWLTTPQMSATQNEYPLVPNVPQQTQPLSTPQIKTEPVDFSVQLQGATYPDTLTPSQLPTHTSPTTSFSTPAMNFEPLLPTPLLDIRFPPAPSLEEQKMRKRAQKAKRRFENVAKMREEKAIRALKKQEARNKTLNSKKKKSRGNKTDDLRKKVKYLCAYNKDNPHKILQILLEHFTHEKILQHYYSNTALKKYIRTVIDNGLLEFNMTIPSGMDTNQPGPSGTSGMDTNQPGPSGTSGPVNPSHGSSAGVGQENSFNVVKMESPLAGDFVNMRKNQQSLVSVIKLTSIQPLVQQRNDRMSIVGLATRSVTVGTQTPTDHFRSLTTDVTDASNNEQMESTMEDSNPEQITSRKVQETNSSFVTSDASLSNVTSNIGTDVTAEDTSESNVTSNIGTDVTAEDTSESNATCNIGTAITVEDTSDSNVTSNIATSNIGTAVTAEDTSESNATSSIGTAVTVEDTSESNATSNIATSNIGTAVTVEDTSESNATSNIGTAITVEDTSESNATSNIATSNIGTAVTVEDTSESNATSNIGTAVTVEDTSESNATSNIATSNIGTAVTVEDTSERNVTSNIGTAVTVEDTSESNATSSIGTAVTVEDTSDSKATSNIGTAVTVEDTSVTSNIGTAVEDASESPEKAEPMITVAYLEDRCANQPSQSLKESVSTSRFKSESSDFSNESHPSPGVVTEPIESARPVAVPPGDPLVVPRGSDEGLLLFENVDMTKYKPSRAAFVTFINVTSTSTLPPPHTSPVAMETETSLTRLNPPTPPSLPHTPQPPVNTESDEEFLYGDNDSDQTPPPDIQLDSPATQLPPDSQPFLDSPPSDQQPAKPPPGDSDPSIDRLLDLIGQSSNPDPPEEPPLIDPPEEPPLIDPPEEPPLMDPPNEPPLLNPPEEPPLMDPRNKPPLLNPPEEPPLMDPPEEPPLVDLPNELLNPPEEPPLLNPPEEPPLLNPPNEPPLLNPPEEPPLMDPPEEPPLVDPPNELLNPPEEPPLLNPPDELPLMEPTSQPSEQRSHLERDGHQSRDTPPSLGRPAHSMLLLEPELQDTTAMLEQAFSILPTLTEWPREKYSKKKKQNKSSMKSKVHCITDTNLNQDSSNSSDEDGKTAVDITKRNKHSTKHSARIHPFTSSLASSNEDTSSYTSSPTPAKKQKQQLRQISPQNKQPDPPSRTQSPREQAPSNQTSGRHSPSTEQDKDMNSDTGMERGSDTGMERGSDTGMERGSDTGMERGSDTGMERGSIKQAGTKHTRDSSLDITPPTKKRRVSSTGDATPSPAHAVSDVINNAVGAEDVIIDVDALPDIIVMEHVSPSSDTDVDVGGDSQYPSLFSPQAKIEWSPKRIDKDGVLETDKEPATRRQIVFPLSTAVDIADSQDLLVDRTKRAPPHIDLLRETSHGDLLRRTYHGDLLKGTSHGDLLRRTSPGEDEIVQVDSPESVAESAVSAKGSPTHEITRTDHQQFAIKLEPTSVDRQLEGAQSISSDKPHSTIESPPSRSSSRASTPRRVPQRLPLKFSTRSHIKLSIDKSKAGDKSVCNRTGELTFGSTPFSQPAYQKLSASNQNEAKQTLLQLREAGIELTRDFCDRSDKAEALIYRIAHAFFTEEHKLQ